MLVSVTMSRLPPMLLFPTVGRDAWLTPEWVAKLLLLLGSLFLLILVGRSPSLTGRLLLYPDTIAVARSGFCKVFTAVYDGSLWRYILLNIHLHVHAVSVSCVLKISFLDCNIVHNIPFFPISDRLTKSYPQLPLMPQAFRLRGIYNSCSPSPPLKPVCN